jgi:hypothetical protein
LFAIEFTLWLGEFAKLVGKSTLKPQYPQLIQEICDLHHSIPGMRDTRHVCGDLCSGDLPTLAEKGLQREPLELIEIFNAIRPLAPFSSWSGYGDHLCSNVHSDHPRTLGGSRDSSMFRRHS